MISMLSGTVAQVSPTALILDVSGVGFLLSCPPTTTSLMHEGSEATLHTHLVVREDSLSLYGFATQQERDAFQIVQSASGVGPKIALAVVSTLTPGQLRHAILSENLAVLSSVPGIGTKVAQRLVLELKEKVRTLDDSEASSPAPQRSTFAEPVIQGLQNLGYSTRESIAAWEEVSSLAEDTSIQVGDLMKAALRSLARN